MRSGIFFICLGLLAFSLRAGESQKLIESFRPELRAEIKALAAQKHPEKPWLLEKLESLLAATWDSRAREEDFGYPLVDSLDYLQRETSSPRLREFCQKFSKAILAQADKEAGEHDAQLLAALQRGLEKGLSATSTKELDPLLADIGRLYHENMYMHSEDMEMRYGSHAKRPYEGAAYAVASLLSAYQVALSSGSELSIQSNGRQDDDAWRRNIPLNAITNGVMASGPLLKLLDSATPRIIKERFHFLSPEEYKNKLHELFAAVTKLEDLDEAFAKIDALQNRQRDLGGDSSDSTEASLLRKDYEIYQAIRTGAGTSLRLNDVTSAADSNPTLVTIKRQLTRQALAQVFKSSPALPPKDDESSTGFLRRVLLTAYATHDWETVARMPEVSVTLHLDDFVNQTDWFAIHHFLTGVNLQKVGPPAEAAASYLSALQPGSSLIPVDFIRDQLHAIHQQFPDAFDGVIPQSPAASK